MSNIDPAALDWAKGNGLIPAIVQHAASGKLLMLAYMNQAALEQTLHSSKVTFYSRSRQSLWKKGETSGNELELVNIDVDCDRDTLLVQAIPAGPVCHLNTPTCFGDQKWPKHAFLGELESIIADRKQTDPEHSYTAQLLHGPTHRAAQKVGEEGVETALAATVNDPQALRSEAADLLYHLLVLLEKCDVSLGDVCAELASRHR